MELFGSDHKYFFNNFPTLSIRFDLCMKTSIGCRPNFCLYFCTEVNRTENVINSKSQLSIDAKQLKT